MVFQHDKKRGLTAEEAALVISGLAQRYSSFSKATFEINDEMGTHEAQYGKGSSNSTQYEILNIRNALLDEIRIACGHLRAKQNNGISPTQITVIELLFEETFDDSLNNIVATKKSIAIWLQGFDPDKSILFDPTESYLQSSCAIDSKKKSSFEDDEMDNYLYFALGVYNNCWKGLLPNMKKPTKKQLKEFINTYVGELPKVVVEAIITLSAPQEHDFQDRTITGTEEWKPLSQRMGKDQ